MPCDIALAFAIILLRIFVGRNLVSLFYGVEKLADAFSNIAKLFEPAYHERHLIEQYHSLLCGHSTKCRSVFLQGLTDSCPDSATGLFLLLKASVWDGSCMHRQASNRLPSYRIAQLVILYTPSDRGVTFAPIKTDLVSFFSSGDCVCSSIFCSI